MRNPILEFRERERHRFPVYKKVKIVCQRTPIFCVTLSFLGSGLMLTGLPARSFAQYPLEGFEISNALHTLCMATSET